MTRTVMCVGTWPEDGCADFEVTGVRPGESDDAAIARATKSYGPDNTFYIRDACPTGDSA